MYKSHHSYLSISVLILFLAISISLQYKVRVSKDTVSLAMGSAAPLFHCQDTTRRLVKLADQRGKVAVICFWHTAFPLCHKALADLEQWQAKQSPQDLVLLGLNSSVYSHQDEAKVFQWVKAEKLSFPILIDWEGEIKEEYGVEQFPTLFLIDANGMVRKVWQGYSPELTQSLDQSIAELRGKHE